ncbi:MAG: cytochrome c oxidase subunit II [Rhodocyclaceae bacterium]|nr:MAG: cytochrome c oxidase subunit II [Rhodocyclaceae bacterium]
MAMPTGAITSIRPCWSAWARCCSACRPSGWAHSSIEGKQGDSRMRKHLLAACAAAAATASRAAEAIRDPAAGWDRLWHEVIIDISILGVAFALITAWFVLRYRRRNPNEVGRAEKLTAAAAVGWTVIPMFVFMADDFFLAANGWQLWNAYRQPPAERIEIKLESGMYSWDYTYPNGVKAQNVLKVPAGKPVLLRMTSRDTIHSHFIPDFRVKEDSMPGRVTFMWFYPQKPGEHIVTCAEYCGIMHSYMVGKVVVVPEAEFAAWYAQEEKKLADGGRQTKKAGA